MNKINTVKTLALIGITEHKFVTVTHFTEGENVVITLENEKGIFVNVTFYKTDCILEK